MGVSSRGSGSGVPDLSALEQDVKPGTDDLWNLGSPAKRWAAIFAVIGIFSSIAIGGIWMYQGADMRLVINGSVNITGHLDVENNLSAANGSFSESLEVGGIQIDGDCIKSSDNRSRVCTQEGEINISYDGMTLMFLEDDGGQPHIYFEDGHAFAIDDITSSDLDDSSMLWGRLQLISSSVRSIASDLWLQSNGDALLAGIGEEPFMWIEDGQVVIGHILEVNNSDGTGVASSSTIRITTRGGVQDGCIYWENDEVGEWFMCMDDSVIDCLRIGTGTNPAAANYMDFCTTGINIYKDTTFQGADAIFTKSAKICIPQDLPKNPTVITVTDGCMFHSANTGASIVVEIIATTGQRYDIICHDTLLTIADNANIHMLGGGNQRCNSLHDWFHCIHDGSENICDYVRT